MLIAHGGLDDRPKSDVTHINVTLKYTGDIFDYRPLTRKVTSDVNGELSDKKSTSSYIAWALKLSPSVLWTTRCTIVLRPRAIVHLVVHNTAGDSFDCCP